jgi:hypothetical protein
MAIELRKQEGPYIEPYSPTTIESPTFHNDMTYQETNKYLRKDISDTRQVPS